MASHQFSHSAKRFLSIFAVVAVLAITASAGTNVIYSFAGDEDGEYLDSDLAIDSQGNLFGTSVQGGDFASGTVFQLSPSGGGWTHTVLYSFTGGTDGGEPYKGVSLDAQGNLYGTAVTGGGGSCEGGCGVVFKLANSGGTWTQSVIHAFSGNDGSGPGARVAFDQNGNLYGMTPTGGRFGAGVIYQMKPDAGGNWKFRVIHSFTGGNDGAGGSAGRLLIDASGTIYGVATVGGANSVGTAFQLTRTQGEKWTFKLIYTFKGQPDAGFPYSGLVSDKAGNLYGTAYYDGAHDLGAVYQLAPRPSGEWKERVLYSFKGGTDGSHAIGTLIFDGGGNLYGTTSEGGSGSNHGTIFKLAPDAGGKWRESIVYRFQGPPDGDSVYNGMVVDKSGNFYGTTVRGGADDEGAIFQFTP